MNGWMRLWVVLSAVYLSVGLCVTIYGFPSKERYREYWVSDGTYAIAKAISAQGVYGDVSNGDVRDRMFKGKNDAEIVAWFQDVIIHPASQSSVYAKDLDSVNARYAGSFPLYQREYLSNSFLALLLPVVLLFILGWAVAWVIRGFRKPPSAGPAPGV